MIARADHLTAPPVFGRYYMVRAIRWIWGEGPATDHPKSRRAPLWWPVWGNLHRDAEFFDLDQSHYHVDPRFLTTRHWRQIYGGDPREGYARTKMEWLQAQPLNARSWPDGPPAPPALRRMRCSLAHVAWRHPGARGVVDLNTHFAGTCARRGRHGFICPHRNFALGSVQAVAGVVTCPLHGLRIDAATGACLGNAGTGAPS